MAKDFDAIRMQRIGSDDERTFILLGETFVAKPAVKPEVLTKYENLSGETGSQSTLEIIDELILAMVEPGEGEWVTDTWRNYPGDERPKIGPRHGAYLQLRSREDGNVVALADLQAVVEWLVERQTGHPTGQRSNSSDGRASTGAGSTGGSPLRAVEG